MLKKKKHKKNYYVTTEPFTGCWELCVPYVVSLFGLHIAV